MLLMIRKTSIIFMIIMIFLFPCVAHPLFAIDPPISSIGEMTIILPPEGYVMGQVNAVNNNGEVVGVVFKFSENNPEDNQYQIPDKTIAFFWSATEGIKLIQDSERDFIFASDINDSGEVVGFLADYSEEGMSIENSRAFYWNKDEGIRDLSDVLGEKESSAMAINNKGHITGYRIKDYGQMAFLLKGDEIIELGSLSNDSWWRRSYSMDINIHDQIVGVSSTDGPNDHAFLWENMEMKDIGICPDKELSMAVGINDNKEIIGYCGNLRCEDFICYIEDYNAFLYTEAEGMIDLGILPGKSDAQPHGINNSGQVVGWCYTKDEQGIIMEYDPFIWTRQTGMQDFGQMIGVDYIFSLYDINDSGQVIGTGFRPELGSYAFLWTPRGIEVEIDIKPGSPVNSINNNGHGVIPVSILGSPDYDILDIDPASLRLEGIMEIKRSGKKEKLQVHIEDVNVDGHKDLVAHFLDIEGAFPENATTATLTGYLYDGTPIKGTDCIRTVH